MVKFLDGATEPHYKKLVFWCGFHEEHGLRNSSNVLFHFFTIVIKVFKAFKIFAPCLKNEAVIQLKANVIY